MHGDGMRQALPTPRSDQQPRHHLHGAQAAGVRARGDGGTAVGGRVPQASHEVGMGHGLCKWVRVVSDTSIAMRRARSIGGRTVLDGEETAQLAEKLTEEFLGRGNEVSKGQVRGGMACWWMTEWMVGRCWRRHRHRTIRCPSLSQLERIVEEEMAILRNLADGSALSEHMEDCYLNALQLAVTGGVVPGQEQKGRG